MTDKDDIEATEKRLQKLFDATAMPPTQDALHRMARAAAQVPDQHPKGLLAWFGLSRWRPALALGLAGAAAFAAWFAIGRGGTPSLHTPAPITEMTAPVYPTARERPVIDDDALLEFAELETDDEELLIEEDAMAVFELDEPLEGPLAALDLLFAPEDEERLEAWADSYESLFDEDG